MLRLTYSKPGDPPREHQSSTERVTLGRAADNDVVLEDSAVSSHHAQIRVDGGQVVVEDLGSTNGTFINGRRLDGVSPVTSEDELYVCAYRLEIQRNAAASPQPRRSRSVAGSIQANAAPSSPGAASPTPSNQASDVARAPHNSGESPIPPWGVPSAPPQQEPRLPTLPPMLNPEQQPSAGAPSSPPASEPPPRITPPEPPAAPPPIDPSPQTPPTADAADSNSSPPPVHGPLESSPPPVSVDSGPPTAPVAVPPAPPTEPESPATRWTDAEPAPTSPVTPPADPPDAPSTPVPIPEPIPGFEPQSPAAPSPPSSRDLPPPVTRPDRSPLSATHAPLPRAEPTRETVRARLGPDPDDEQVRDAVFLEVRSWLADGPASLPTSDCHDRARERCQALLRAVANGKPGLDPASDGERMAGEMCGFGPLTPWLSSDRTLHIFVRGTSAINVHTTTGAELGDGFTCPSAVETTLQRLTDRRFTAAEPILDCHTASGVQVQGVHATLASGETVARVSRPLPFQPWSLDRLLRLNLLSPRIANVLASCLEGGLNILVAEGPGADALPIMLALSESTEAAERHVLVTTRGKAASPSPRMVVLEANRPQQLEALLSLAAGMQPDRVFVHGLSRHGIGEALAIAQSGTRGTFISLRASSCEQAFRRLSAMAVADRGESGVPAVGGDIAGYIDVIVSVQRHGDGRLHMVELAEVVANSTLGAKTTSIFTFDAQHKRWSHTGHVPAFFERLNQRGIPTDPAMLED